MLGQPLRRVPPKRFPPSPETDRAPMVMCDPPTPSPSQGERKRRPAEASPQQLRAPLTARKQAKAESGPISVKDEHLYFGTRIA